MTTITTKDLQDIAVSCVTSFLNEKVPLEVSLSKQACERDLTSDQLARAVEATNTLAFLKVAEVTGDKTVEFPLAKYENVLAISAAPSLDNSAPVDLQKSASASKEVPTHELTGTESISNLDCSQLLSQIYKFAHINSKALEIAQEKMASVTEKIVRQANVLRKQENSFDLLSASSVDSPTFVKISSFMFDNKPRRSNLQGMFKSASLSEIESFTGLWKEAELLKEEIEVRTDLKNRSDEIINTMIKEAAAARLASAIGSGVGKIVAAPIAYAAKTVSKPVRGVVNYAKARLQTAASNTDLGKRVGIPSKPANPVVQKRLATAKAAIGASAGAGLDAAFYEPDFNIKKDRVGDVWSALN